MKVTSFTGVSQIDNVKIFKPVNKIFVKTIYNGVEPMDADNNPSIRVRLVDGRNGRSDELVPEMELEVLSEIASKYEGFQRRAVRDTQNQTVDGYDLHSVILGAIVGTGVGEECAAIDLSNDKYLDIDMRNLNPNLTYEIWGFEHHIISSFARTYRKFYLSVGELEKSFFVEGNEVLAFKISDLKEIQFYALNGSSPVYRKDELILDEDTRNDLVSVQLDDNNLSRAMSATVENTNVVETILGIRFGYADIGVIDLRPYKSFDFRREDGMQAVMFLMIDTTPSLPTVVQNVVISDPSPVANVSSSTVLGNQG